MSGQALGAGTGRKRVAFGLLDRDGWTWASVKAALWFVTIVMLLGYLPDRAYYFTVFPTIDLGVLAYSPINFCPPTNRTLPCPAPAGATLPWDGSPAQLALPAGRTDGTAVQLGSHLMYVGGSDGKAAVGDTFVSSLYAGNFGPWASGPALPAARSGAAVAVLNSAVYVVGGTGPDGKPTDTVYVASQDLGKGTTSAFAASDVLKLPEARSGATLIAASDGLLLIGGTNGSAIQPTVWKSTIDKNGKLQAWTVQAPMPAGRTQSAGALIGDYLFVYGGRDASGASRVVYRGSLGKETANLGQIVGWGTPEVAAAERIDLPAARARAAYFSANGALYLVGGEDASGSHPEMYWTTPDAKGEIPGWQHLTATDLPTGLAGGAAVVSGSQAFIVGGTTSSQPAVAGSARSNLAPQPPFFQLGLFGATVPALKVGGEIGQQLGYLSAAGVGTVDFVLLLLIGWGLAHQERVRAMMDRFRGRRRR